MAGRGPAAIVRNWWAGQRRLITDDTSSVCLAVLPLHHKPGAMRAAVRRLRRGLRDMRDRRWRSVCMAGMANGDGEVLVLIWHLFDARRPEVR
jgi:hypothetical protein